MVEAIAGRAAQLGSPTEVVGVLPGDGAGDRRLLHLASRGIGHAAVLRTTAANLDPADLELALRYLPDLRAIVLVEPSVDLVAPAVAASAWSGAALVIVTSAPTDDGDAGSNTWVLAAPKTDPDEAFAGVVADLAHRLHDGADPGQAWQATLTVLGLEPAVDPAPEDVPAPG